MPMPLHHASFTLERHFEAPPAAVFAALTGAEARRRWLVESDGWTLHAYTPPARMDPGTIEYSRFSPPGSNAVLTNRTVFLDIEPDARLVFAFTMTLDGAHLSSSLTCVDLEPDGAGTRLTLVEQGAFVDDDVPGRTEGTRLLLESLAQEVAGR